VVIQALTFSISWMETEVISDEEWREIESAMQIVEEKTQVVPPVGLPDYLTQNLKLVFVGDNPGLTR
jgi:hypothetical protein